MPAVAVIVNCLPGWHRIFCQENEIYWIDILSNLRYISKMFLLAILKITFESICLCIDFNIIILIKLPIYPTHFYVGYSTTTIKFRMPALA